MARIVLIGPAYPLRGGISAFNHRLANELLQQGHTCKLISFSLQYPSFLFPGKTQYSNDPAPANLIIESAINSINPFNWWRVGKQLRKEKPDIIIVRYWLPFMAPALGTILRSIKKNKHTKVICIADNILPHEKRLGDRAFTNYFIKSCDAFVVMSKKVNQDLASFTNEKPVRLLSHPLYDHFGEIISKEEAKKKLGLSTDEKIILFFGFIRKYKGLDILLQAMARLKDNASVKNLKLIVAGEFYEDENQYRQQIANVGIGEMVMLQSDFIPDAAVKYYLCAADVLIQPYRNATQSGVTPLAYHFEKPTIVTNVGGLPDLVLHEKTGLVVAPTAQEISDGIARFYELGESHFTPYIRQEKIKYSWSNFCTQLLALANEIQ